LIGRQSEQGFVLLAALWLLLLVGSIAAFLMLRSIRASTELKAEEQALRERHALSSAVDTIIADVIFNGPRSQWRSLPASGAIVIDGETVQIRLSPENGRLDLNGASPETIDDLLRGLDVPAQTRSRLLASLNLRRAAAKPIGSMSELESVLKAAGLEARSRTCLLDLLTPFTALPAPRLEVAPEPLRAALARAGQEDGVVEPRSVPIGPTEPVRMLATVGHGRQLNVVLRVTGTTEAPYLVHHWSERPLC
jgi:hypothetical protein